MLCCCDTVEPPVTGACCEGAVGGIGICNERTQADCQDNNGDYQGDGTTCNPNPCPSTAGACCYDDGSCETTEVVRCTARGGTYQGDGTTCSPNPCPQPTGACCDFDGSCEPDVTEATCQASGRVWQGANTVCNPNPCPQPGPCQFCAAGDIPNQIGIDLAGIVAKGAVGTWIRDDDAAAWLNGLGQLSRVNAGACSYQDSIIYNDVDPIFGGAITTTITVSVAYQVAGAFVEPFLTITYSQEQPGANLFCNFTYRADFPAVQQPVDCTAGRPVTALTLRATDPNQPGGFGCAGIGAGEDPLTMGTAEITGGL